jgi:hypothetical protein
VRTRDRDGFLLSSGRGARLCLADDPLGRCDWLAVAQLGGDLANSRNQPILLAAELPEAAISTGLRHLVSLLPLLGTVLPLASWALCCQWSCESLPSPRGLSVCLLPKELSKSAIQASLGPIG